MTNLSKNAESSNSNTFEGQINTFTSALITTVTSLSPIILVLTILGIACAGAAIEFVFQKSVFGAWAFVPGILLGSFRFSSGMGGVWLLKNSKFLPAIFFMLISFLLTLYTSFHVDVIALTIAPDAVAQATITLRLILWGSLIGEAMLAIYARTGKDVAPMKGLKWFSQKRATNGQTVEN